MICPKCHTPLDLAANSCPHCGVSLKRSGGRFLAVTACIVLAILIGVYGYLQYRFTEKRMPDHMTAADALQNQAAPVPPRYAEIGNEDADRLTKDYPTAIKTADLILRDITGRQLGTYLVTPTSSGWFAFPKQLCIGAYSWEVMMEEGHVLPVEGGVLQDEDSLGLWQVPVNSSTGGLQLAPWDRNRPLHWFPLDNTPSGQIVQVRTAERMHNFEWIPPDDRMSGPGLFVQDKHLVGWGFGDPIPGGYLWTGNHGSELIPEFYTDDFYRLTFEGGREEALLLALADPDVTDLERLASLVEAHRLEPRMPRERVPVHIADSEIHARMRSLVQNLIAQGRIDDLLMLLDPQALLAIDHPPLLFDLVDAAQQAGEFAYARTLIETLSNSGAFEPEQVQTFAAMQSSLYQDWLDRLIAEGNLRTAGDIYQEASERLPQDPAIHLLGVELALQHGDWALAERLLAARIYPEEFRDRTLRLRQTISDLKSQEGRIVLRFPPGSRTVPVTAVLNRGISQAFLIDTGASIVTVPAETVRRLGIDLSDSLPRRLFYSATGVQNAVEVTLPSIELEGWVVANVKALVVDLPGQPGLGLLGMNFLSYFRMDLNTDEGLLMLMPR